MDVFEGFDNFYRLAPPPIPISPPSTGCLYCFLTRSSCCSCSSFRTSFIILKRLICARVSRVLRAVGITPGGMGAEAQEPEADPGMAAAAEAGAVPAEGEAAPAAAPAA